MSASSMPGHMLEPEDTKMKAQPCPGAAPMSLFSKFQQGLESSPLTIIMQFFLFFQEHTFFSQKLYIFHKQITHYTAEFTTAHKHTEKFKYYKVYTSWDIKDTTPTKQT